MHATLMCLKKINFFDWLIQEINKFKFVSNDGGFALDIRQNDSLRKKHIVSLLSLTQFFCCNHGELFLNDLFCFQEKIDNFKTLNQLLKFNFQNTCTEIKGKCLSIFELLIVNIQKLKIEGNNNNDEESDNINYHRKVIKKLLKFLFEKTCNSSSAWIDMLEILMVHNEIGILEELNECGEVYQLILNGIDFQHFKIRTLKCLQIFKTLLTKNSNTGSDLCAQTIFQIYSLLNSQCTGSRCQNMFYSIFILLQRFISQYRSNPRFALIVSRFSQFWDA
jgi:hypothetical protein